MANRNRLFSFVAICIGLLACLLPAAALGQTPAPVPAAAPDASIQLRTADAKDLADLVASQRGKVVLIDCWATWCRPCIEQFPHTVGLWRKFGDRGLVVVSLAMNDDEDREAVLRFLQTHGATFDNLQSRTILYLGGN